MNTLATRAQAPYPLVSTATRLAAAVAVVSLLATLWLSAERASHDAVQHNAQAFSRNVIYVTLPTVEIVGQRVPAAIAASAAMAPRDRIGQAERTL